MISLSHLSVSIPDNVYQLSERGYSQLIQRQDLEFLKLPYKEDMWAAVKKRANEIRKNYDQVVVVGIGGSSLGTSMLYQALLHHLDRKVFFFDNVDGLAFWHHIKKILYDTKTHWVIVSKSGSTVETLAQTQFIHQVLLENRIKLSQHATVITEESPNPLYHWATKTQTYLLKLPKTLVGRYSVLSPVSLLPMAFAGLDIEDLQNGAIAGLKNKNIVIELIAQTFESWQRKEWITLIWSYSDGLRQFGFWLQQLWSESLAKANTHKGLKPMRVSTPMPLVGTCDQHSVLQQVVEGFHDKFVWFIRSKEAECFGPQLSEVIFPTQSYIKDSCLGSVLATQINGTRQLLNQKQIPSLTLGLNQQSALIMGELAMVLQLMVGSLGEILDINAFNQPGVDLCKKLTEKYLT